MLGCEYNTAWFLHHRVMEAMRRGGLDLPPMGGPGEVVEIDEAYHGPVKERVAPPSSAGLVHSPRVATWALEASEPSCRCYERGGEVRSFHVPTADAETVAKIVRENVHKETRIHTDESKLYIRVGTEFAAHETVNHAAREYARGDVTTNTVEGYFWHLQARDAWQLPALRREEFAPLPCGI